MIAQQSRSEVTERCRHFLVKEAKVLDDFRLWEWLDMLTADVQYQVPIRITKERRKPGDANEEFSDDSYLYNEDWASLETRIERFETGSGWSEIPPSRTRRFVSNLYVGEFDGSDVPVRSYMLVYRSQGDTAEANLITGERQDILREEDGELKLADRTVFIDHTILPMRNLSIFL